MIGRLGYHHALVTGHVPRDLRRQVVGLATGAGEDAGVDIAGHALDQHFAELDDRLVQVAGMGVERGRLPAERLDDPWMTMSDRDHVVVAVEVPAPVGVPKSRAFAAYQVQWPVEKILVGRAERFAATLDQLLVIHRDLRPGCG